MNTRVIVYGLALVCVMTELSASMLSHKAWAEPTSDHKEGLNAFEDTLRDIDEMEIPSHMKGELREFVNRERQRERELDEELEIRSTDAISSSTRRTAYNDIIATVRPTNPLITPQCRRDAKLWSRQYAQIKKRKTKEYILNHEEKTAADYAAGKINASEFFNHIKKCVTCGSRVARLVSCHVDALANISLRDRVLVLFDVGEAKVRTSDNVALRRFARRVLNSDKIVLFWGSASNLGKFNYEQNLELSKRRAEAVRNILREVGFPSHRLYAQWTSTAPPRLWREAISKRLGWHRRWKAMANHKYMDQNVILAAFDSSDDGLEAHHH